jgi:hypothetical protein
VKKNIDALEFLIDENEEKLLAEFTQAEDIISF